MQAAKYMKPDREILDDVMLPHLIQVAMQNVHKDNDGQEIPAVWMRIINEAVSFKFKGLDILTQRRIATQIQKDTDPLLVVVQCDTYKELALTVSLLALELVEQGLYIDSASQSVLVAAKVADEALTYQDWGNVKLCKKSAELLQNHLNFMGYYTKIKASIH